jgi:hypothetical protein
VCDLDDGCVDEPDPSQDDTDGDGIGDACDPCTNVLPVFAVKSKITLQRLVPPPGDDAFKFSGSITIPAAPPIDPAANGVRILISDAPGNSIVDATIPPGLYDGVTKAGWKVNGSATTFVYRNAGVAITPIAGVSKVTVKLSSRTPGLVRFNIAGKSGSYVLPSSLPVTGTFVLDPPYATTNLCGEAVFPGPTSPACAYVPPAGTVKCK